MEILILEILILEALMNYSIKQLADLAGVSTRTLRWYDTRGLLSPKRLPNGYRIYGANEVDQLQHILFYRELGFDLEKIATLMRADDYDVVQTLRTHLDALAVKRRQLDVLMETMNRTIATYEGGTPMSDAEKFEAFKREAIRDNEERYGAEIRGKYGEETVEASNQQFAGMTPERYAEMEALTERLHEALRQAVAQGDATNPLAREVADMHRQWLGYFWLDYTPERHKGVTQMYVEDPRFSAYYEAIVPGGAAFLRDAVWSWLE
ncbi:MAG: MerR family transcriptional regulator [Coriobacteriales bacterium]|nr:MerR family transcriptional regulator [Coriobacteriales bacterium]